MAFDRKQWRSDRHKKLVTVTLQCEEKCRSLEAQLVTVTLQCDQLLQKCITLERAVNLLLDQIDQTVV